MTRPALAAITLRPAGGGVAAVARLLERAMREQWGSASRLVTLLDDREGDVSPLHSSTASRLRFGAALAAAQALGHCDAIVYSHLSLAKVQRVVPAVLRRPHVVFLHGIEAWGEIDAAERWALSGAALRVANSAYTAGRIRDRHGAIGDIAICPLALPPAPLVMPSNRREELGRHAVLVVARMSAAERYKGHDALLEAWPAVLRRVPDARLVFVGDGDDVARLRTKAGALGIGEAVEFTGFVSDADRERLYERAALFAMPSRGEGFGIVYLEAMAHGLACIGSIHDAAAEVIVDGVTGHLVDQGNVPALADRVTVLLLDVARRQELGEAGRRRVQQQFTFEHFSRRFRSLIEGAAAQDGATSVAWARRS